MDSYDGDNIFARMMRGEIPATRVFEDEHVLAIMDIFPQSKGHGLFIRRARWRSVVDGDPARRSATMRYAQRIARAVQAALKPDGIRIMQINEAPAGQSVCHLHFHIV